MSAAIPLAALMAGVLLEVLLARVLSPRGKGWLAFCAALAALGGTLWMVPGVSGGKALDATLIPWDQGLPLSVHVDGLGLLFALMATGIGAAILLYSVDYMAHEPGGTTRFYALMLTFIAGLVNLVVSSNLLLAYLSWEVIGLCSYFLVGFWYQNPAAANGARKVLLMTHLPGYALLLGILLLYGQAGTFIWTDPAIAAHFTTGIFFLMLFAAMAKSVIFPLHTWIPEAMNAPTPVSALLHSACYVKAGVYLVARMYSFSGAAGVWPEAWQTAVLALGCATMLVGALFALAQTDLKRLLAFSTISQLGYILTGIGLGTPAGVFAGLFYCFSHGLFKGTLFLCAGAVQHATGTRDLNRLGGLAARMPRTLAAWLVAACAIVGVPLTNGFVAKWLLFDAALSANLWAVVVVAWLVSVITAFYMLKATVSLFFGEMPEWLRNTPTKDASPRMLAGMGFLALLCMLFGLAPQWLAAPVVAPAAAAIGFASSQALTWLGVHAAVGGAPVVAGAAIIFAALIAAWAVYRIARPHAASPAAAVSIFTGGDPIPAGEGLTADDFAEIAQDALAPVLQSTDPDPLYLLIWRWLRNLAGWFDRALAAAERRPLIASLLLAAVVLAAIWLK